ncbi:unnamed protein product [Arctogadus glacialis]
MLRFIKDRIGFENCRPVSGHGLSTASLSSAPPFPSGRLAVRRDDQPRWGPGETCSPGDRRSQGESIEKSAVQSFWKAALLQMSLLYTRLGVLLCILRGELGWRVEGGGGGVEVGVKRGAGVDVGVWSRGAKAMHTPVVGPWVAEHVPRRGEAQSVVAVEPASEASHQVEQWKDLTDSPPLLRPIHTLHSSQRPPRSPPRQSFVSLRLGTWGFIFGRFGLVPIVVSGSRRAGLQLSCAGRCPGFSAGADVSGAAAVSPGAEDHAFGPLARQGAVRDIRRTSLIASTPRLWPWSSVLIASPWHPWSCRVSLPRRPLLVRAGGQEG